MKTAPQQQELGKPGKRENSVDGKAKIQKQEKMIKTGMRKIDEMRNFSGKMLSHRIRPDKMFLLLPFASSSVRRTLTESEFAPRTHRKPPPSHPKRMHSEGWVGDESQHKNSKREKQLEIVCLRVAERDNNERGKTRTLEHEMQGKKLHLYEWKTFLIYLNETLILLKV